MPRRRTLRPGTRGEEIIGALFGFLVGYMASEAVLATYIHPLHWVSPAIIAAIAYVGTLLWYRSRYPLRPGMTPGNQQADVRSRWSRWWRPRRHQ